MTEFECVTLSPLTAASGGMIRATWRAGATALVDLSPVVDPAALEVLRRTDDRGELAFRATPDQAPLLDGFAGRRQRLVLWDWRPAELPQLLANLDRPGREIWLEVLDIGEALMVPGELPVGGWVGRGSECGGRCGRQAAFILAQALARQVRPFWIQGGIGVHSAVAARVAGAAGVVLDDALLLLREFPLPPGWRAVLADHASDDTAVLGGHLGETWRVAGHRDLGGFQRCAEAARRIEESVDAPARWRATARSHVGWGDPAKMAWPLGQLAGCAGDYARRYGTTGRLIAAVRRAVATNPAAASRRADLSPGSPLARAHGTRYPIVQGPMTRVSDVVPFAQAVAEAGALPMLALATMPGPQVNTLLEQAQADLADRPWGVGLLGYLAPELAEAQIEALARWTPSIALIAGGRPDQAKRLERLGINTYIHVPSPELLRLFLDQGARRFVFEGAECGGHTGPLNSFPLWDATIEALSSWTGDQLHVLFAGGIHDAPSAAMVAAMAASLGPAPVQTGVLMGSAYLFTNEAVATRAIVPAFQSIVVECAETTVIETGPGHRIRCVPTPFVQEFDQLRDRLHRGACAPKEIREALEAAVVGRLRIASKGLARQGDHLVPVDPAEQQAAGLFMVGELATLHNDTYTCARLHNTVSGDSMAVLSAMACGADRAGAATTLRVGLGDVVGVEAAAVVGDLEAQAAAAPHQAHLHLARAGVALSFSMVDSVEQGVKLLAERINTTREPAIVRVRSSFRGSEGDERWN
jgi:NAD(P)H-dependent flavin oxidoreductase YrpB (nitropropane dioxygenase family)